MRILTLLLFLLAFSAKAMAHCDTLDGPVVQDAKRALEKRDVTPALKWVKKEAEPEIRAAFQTALSDRVSAREAADMKFFETLVRLHRAGEGAPFSGLKPAGSTDPAVARADRALESDSTDEMIARMTNDLSAGIKKRFDRAAELKKHKDESVEAGRAYVEAYVRYIHYVEHLHRAVSGGQAHGARKARPPGRVWSDEELIKLAYAKGGKYPSGFYRENPEGAIYYEDNRELLFTDSVDAARQRSDASAQASSEPTDFVESRENEKYFEFKRARPGGPFLLSRVHKAGYYEGCYPYNCSRDGEGETVGYLKFRPLSKERVKEAIEYLWYIKNLDFSGPKVLSSAVTETPEKYILRLEVLWFGKGDWGLNDTIALEEELFHIDKDTGLVRKYSKNLRSLRGEYNSPPLGPRPLRP